ncbi:adenylate cyclase [Halocaridina rubra]|uniref:N-acyl-aliphatic-L-amino acid amidohydrolase n=1 Tax=Halocaridina rubra TaxID=373956 RepID=A0AAN8X629_HALRR
MAEEHPSVTNFRNYIRIKTVQPNPDYATCTQYLQGQAKELGAEFQVVECVPGKPIVVMTLRGRDPTLPSVLLNSHTDVVPALPEHWTYEPFSAHKAENGNIYGRGTQDMKCVGVQYLEALKRLRKDGVKFLRTVYLSFVPDEEIGGTDGMGKFIETKIFKDMNVGFALDEGLASPTEKFRVFNGERTPWWIMIKCPGQPGHGSQFLPNNSGVKLQESYQ